MSRKPALFRMEPDDFVSRWGVHGCDHLYVEGSYDETGKLYGWTILDKRFTPGLDRWNRAFVLFVDSLQEVRDWVHAGGPALWDPERRKVDKKWRPVPDEWQAREARGEAPGRTDSGVRSGQRVVGGGQGSLQRGRRGEGCEGVVGAGQSTHRSFWSSDVDGKKYAVCPSFVVGPTGERYFIDFDALAWLYGVKPSECLEVPPGAQDGKLPDKVESLVWLYPRERLEDYEALRAELARGRDAFKLEEPEE